MPKIQKIEQAKKNPNKVNIFFEDKTIGVHIDTMAHFACYEGKELTHEEIEEIHKHSLQGELQEKVINYITYSPRTERQIRQYIQKNLKKYEIPSDEIVEEIIEKLKDFKYINDREYAELFVKSRLKNKPKSRYFLFSELNIKGIEKELANEVLDELLPDSFEILKKAYEKKYREEPITLEDKKKISFLQRKGFSWDDILKLVNYFEEKNG